MVAFQVAGLAGINPLQLHFYWCREVDQIADIQIVNLSTVAANQDTVRSDPRKVLIFDKIEHSEFAFEFEARDGLGG